MGLGGKRPAAAGEALEQHRTPQRARAVEAVRPEVRGPGEQLALAAGLRKRGARDVGRDVEALVGLPLRPAQAAGGAAREPLAVARQGAEAPLEVAAYARQRRRAAPRERIEDE